MKKLLLSIFAIILCLPILAFAGCSQKANVINMPTYFDTTVETKTYKATSSSKQENALQKFTSKNNELAQYMYLKFTGKSDWLYKMTIEYVEFEVLASVTEEIEMIVKITNLKNSDQSSVGGASIFSKTISIPCQANKSIKVQVPVNDIIKSYSSTTTLTLEITDQSYFSGDNENLGLTYTIQNLKVIGGHKQQSL